MQCWLDGEGDFDGKGVFVHGGGVYSRLLTEPWDILSLVSTVADGLAAKYLGSGSRFFWVRPFNLQVSLEA